VRHIFSSIKTRCLCIAQHFSQEILPEKGKVRGSKHTVKALGIILKHSVSLKKM
jgi:hypothetical protein